MSISLAIARTGDRNVKMQPGTGLARINQFEIFLKLAILKNNLLWAWLDGTERKPAVANQKLGHKCNTNRYRIWFHNLAKLYSFF